MIKSIEETIAAQATPAGEGGIAIIRISGDLTEQVLNRIFKSKTGEKLKNRVMTFGKIKFKGEEVDEVMSVFMKGPYTYTRQDVGEIHCHGSQFIVGRILQILIQNGIRIAQPGEFTYRAFVNGRVDLTQAEAVMRLIQANNEKARKSAVRQINGGISGLINSSNLPISCPLLSILTAPISMILENLKERPVVSIINSIGIFFCFILRAISNMPSARPLL